MTTPYVTGTVSVTAGSAIVTGVGTGWLTSGLVAGQFGLDSANGNPVPVLSIDSDTEITLAKPWRGTTASAQGYWITYDTTPGQQTVANAQMLALYLSRLDKPALAALASLTPAADKLPYFGANGAGALADFNAAARALLAGGILADGQLPARIRVTSPNSTTANALDNVLENGFSVVSSSANVALVNGPPGAGAGVCLTIMSTVNSAGSQTYWNMVGNDRIWTRRRSGSAWSAWALTGIPILGSVSQASGVPTGAVIERGSNANGEYVRFADGTQICSKVLGSFAPNQAIGANIFRNDTGVNWTFPVAFSVIPYASYSAGNGTSCWANGWGVSATTAAGRLYSAVSSGTLVELTAFAIGRWY
ncbi:pyocin knob domain-containing protein [Agrobacterium rosae]|uniref:pyocin knob domain-containing protein n=1 Tax=Agrobacterium rosae TaxID=1972867 RepID=UPI00203335EA|nr:pyocin knob domain-containing protein [Agrobacterium rosae]MCM2432106.1 phage tail protein [Agrobacterium rosae]